MRANNSYVMYISPRIQLNIYTVSWWYKIGFKELTHFEETFSSAILFLMSLFNNREFPNGNPIRFVWSFVSMETKRWKGYKIVISTFWGNSHIRIFVPNWKLRTTSTHCVVILTWSTFSLSYQCSKYINILSYC